MGTIHAARFEKSDRLQKMREALRNGPRTTAELQRETGDMAVHTTIDELRKNKIAVACRYLGRSDAGRKIYQYEILGEI